MWWSKESVLHDEVAPPQSYGEILPLEECCCAARKLHGRFCMKTDLNPHIFTCDLHAGDVSVESGQQQQNQRNYPWVLQHHQNQAQNQEQQQQQQPVARQTELNVEHHLPSSFPPEHPVLSPSSLSSTSTPSSVWKREDQGMRWTSMCS